MKLTLPRMFMFETSHQTEKSGIFRNRPPQLSVCLSVEICLEQSKIDMQLCMISDANSYVHLEVQNI